MYRIITLTVAALMVVTSCNKSAPDPVAEAIEAAAMKDTEGPYTFRITNLAKLDSTTFRTEIDRRKEQFVLKQQAEEKLYHKYFQEAKKQNAENHRLAMEKAKNNLEYMDALEAKMAARLDEIAYYDYVFSGYSETEAGRVTYNDVYVTITPEGEVLTMTADKRDMHKSTGRVIPGYIETITSITLSEE